MLNLNITIKEQLFHIYIIAKKKKTPIDVDRLLGVRERQRAVYLRMRQVGARVRDVSVTAAAVTSVTPTLRLCPVNSHEKPAFQRLLLGESLLCRVLSHFRFIRSFLVDNKKKKKK